MALNLPTLRDIIHTQRLSSESDTPHIDQIQAIIQALPPGVATNFSLKLTQYLTETFRELRTLRKSTRSISSL